MGLLIGHKSLVVSKGVTKEGCLCSTCGAVCSRKTSLVRHQRGNHGLPGGIQCPICGKITGDKSNLESHMSSHNRYDNSLTANPGREQL